MRLKSLVDILAGVFLLALITGGVWLSLKKEAIPERVQKLESMKKGDFSFKFHDLKNKPYNLDEYLDRVVLVNIWATWCPPCVEEIPSLLKLAQKFQKELVIVAVSEESTDVIKEFFSRFPKPTKNFILATSSDVRDVFSPVALPESYLLDKEGRLSLKISGPQHWNQLMWHNRIRELYSQK